MSDTFSSPTRREFLKRSGLLVAGAGVAGLSATPAAAADVWPPLARDLVNRDDVILFQGDSITDAGRKKDDPAPNEQPALGNGYAWLAAVELLVDRPKFHLKVFNRGISGNKVYQLSERWQTDCLDLKPNLLSILIGVNDLWHTLNGSYQGSVHKYENDYRELLEHTRHALPHVKLVICEPFVLRCGAVNDKWFPEFDLYRAVAKRMADLHKALFIPFQTMFDQALQYAPPAHWAADGVHPTPAGASLMAFNWLRIVAGKR